ncbi:MAG: hypothetical protein L3J89_12045 [Gammaproteobacteria bacterium]|nr:hypothetical protein [Gammaproteobacteria bacterium]
MKTKLLTGITVVLMALSTPLLANSAHHQDKASESTMQSGSMAMIDMEKMHEHMNKMKETMAKIHRTENKEVRQKLMQKHMKEMHQGMGMMSGGAQKNMSDMKGKHSAMQDLEKVKNGHHMMEKRMDMMQGMMSQMMEHMMQQQNMSMEK